MKKKVFSLMMTLLLAFMGVARADELTVNDGTTTNGYVPVYGYYADAYLKCEFVQPAADLADMNGGTINGLTFYASQSSVDWGTANFEVFLTEVEDATLSAFVGDGTIVYQGALSIVDGTMNVTFTEPYTYNGGNLLIGVYNLATGSYVTSTWYGVEAETGASVSGYNYSSLSSISASQRPFLPKMTFDYTPAAGGAPVTTTDNYDFEDNALPEGWTVEGPGNWHVGTGDNSTATGANSGSYNALITHSSSGNVTYLVTPAMDLSNAISGTVNCWYVNRSWAGDTDEFGVYYRVDGGDWNELFYTNTTHSTWTEMGETALTGFAANYQLGFMMTDNYGYGVGVDDIQISITTAGGGVIEADLTVHDGTATNNYVPVYGTWADAYLKCEMVYPATELSDMAGGEISAITYYLSSPASEAWTGTWQVFMYEVDDTTISDFYGDNRSVVYEGLLDGTSETMTINFSTPYTYNGGNLLVGIYQIVPGIWKNASFYGESVSGTSVQGYSSTGLDYISSNQRNFLPKTTFDYTITAPAGPEPIAEVYIEGFTEPVWGAAFDNEVNVPEDANYSLMMAGWYHYNPSRGETAEQARLIQPEEIYNLADEVYVMQFLLSANEGYEFTNNYTAYINGSTEFVGETTDLLGNAWVFTTEFSLYQAGLHTLSTYAGNESIDRLIIERPNGAWMEPYHFNLYNDGAEDVEVVLIDFLFNNGYFSMAEGTEYPIAVAADGRPGVDLYINTNIDWTSTDEINSKLAVNTNERSTHLYQIVAAPYQPYCPDVVETAYNLNDGNALAADFSWREFMSEIWDGPADEYELHANYDLPDFEENIPDGYDAVMKFTIDHPMNLNARVVEGYENGKVALYRADFDGEAGPMATNNYTGRPMSGAGGSTGGSFEAVIGNVESTSTFSYAPYYQLYYNSLSETLYLASELAGNGVTTAPMTSLSWYANSDASYMAHGIQIWMANVSEETVSTTSHLTSGMTRVYSGDIQPVQGWNEFVFNVGSFAWDGHSNVLISVLRNDTEWHSGPAWRAENPGFNGAAYDYDDYTVYNPTTETYPLSISTYSPYRPIITMKGGNRTVTDRVKRGDRTTATVNPHLIATRAGQQNHAGMTNWGNAFRGSTAYGICVYNDGTLDYGINQFDIDNLAGATVINSYNGIGGMVYDPNNACFYVSDYSNSLLYTVEADGTILNTVTTPYAIVSLAWDPTTNTLYSMDSYSWLNITDPATGNMTDIDALSNNNVMCITANATGQLFGVLYGSTSSALVSIDKTDATVTTLCTLDAPCNYAQSMAFDMNDNKLYWAQSFDESNLYEVNPITGDLTLKAANTSEICGLCIPAVETPAPVDPEEPVVANFHYWSAGPVITDLNVVAGTYYLVASSTDADYEVEFGISELPCPEKAIVVSPVDNAMNLDPTGVVLRWALSPDCIQYRLVFGTTYYPDDEPEHPQTIITEWSSNLAESYALPALWNNTNYFWRIDQRTGLSDEEPGCVTTGDVWGFTTHLNVPQNLEANDYSIFEDEPLTLTWNAIQDRTYRHYYIYKDGEYYDQTALTPDPTAHVSYTFPAGSLTYNMEGYTFSVTAVYDEGESAHSNEINVKVSGYSNNTGINGYAYEQDGVTGIPGVTVTITGTDEFGDPHTYTTTTGANGYYHQVVYAGNYTMAVANKPGYQETITNHTLPFTVAYNGQVNDVNFIMDENFVAPAHVCAQTMYAPGVTGDTLVQVYWDFNFCAGDYEAQIGNGTSTTGYMPFYTLYNYSIATALYRADELVEAGVTTAPMNSLSWYANNAPGYAQQGITIWMANVTDNTVSSTSPLASGMTKVYTGAMTPAMGWNEFVFNENDFEWDGESNILILVQRLNGSWNSTVNWRYTNAGFNAMSYDYDDYEVYNVENQTYSMSTSANRPNIIMKGSCDRANEAMRSLHHFNIYRTDCYNDGPYNSENTDFVATAWVPDTSYFDVGWPTLAPGVYKYGVSAVYAGNRDDVVDYPFEERESEIVWHTGCAPCLDKDMQMMDVTVNVVLNSADSPEGSVVTFTNLNPGEQQDHAIAPVVLDQTGYYEFPTFRRGVYEVLVHHPGYEDETHVIDLWNDDYFVDTFEGNTVTVPGHDLRFVLTEIIYEPINLYVSRTGWATWAPFIPEDGDTPTPTPTPGEGVTSFSENFDAGMPTGWTTIDANNDGFDWMFVGDYPYADYTGEGHNNSYGFAISESYDNGTYTAITPDNYLVSPLVSVVNGSTFSFWATDGNDSYGAEHYGVAISTTGNTNAADFTTIAEWTLLSKGGAKEGGQRQLIDGVWYQKTVDLSAYAGQNIYIAVRHFNCNDQWVLCVDDFELTSGRSDDRHLEGYKVLCTSIDGQPIYNVNTVHPFCQLATDQLVEGEQYMCYVASIYSTGMSDYISCTWQYESCEHYPGTVDGVHVDGNVISWTYPGGGQGPVDPDPQPGNEVTVVLNVPSDIWGDGTGYQLCLDADHNTYGTTIPTTGNFTAGTFADFEYTIPENAVCDYNTNTIVINGSQSITIPAGVYDYVFLNPFPGGPYYIASDYGQFPGRGDDYEFLAGKTYTFTLSVNNYDNITLVITDTEGRTVGFGSNDVVADNTYCRVNENYVAPVLSSVGTSLQNNVIGNTEINRDGYLQYCSDTYGGGIGTGGGQVWWAVMFTPAQLTAYNGQDVTKVGVYTGSGYGWTYTGNYTASVYQGGTNAPGTLMSSKTEYIGVEDAWYDITLDTPVTIDASQNLWLVFNATLAYPMSNCESYMGDMNSTWASLDGVEWDYVSNLGVDPATWMIRAFVEEGTTPTPVDPTVGENILGAMIFVDGEWEAFVEAPVNEYVYEGEGEEVCVRIVYNGPAELPANNIMWSMSCEECEGGLEPGAECEAGDPIYAEVIGSTDQVHIWWGNGVEPIPVEGSTWAYDFENSSLDGLTSIDADGDGYGWVLGSAIGGIYLVDGASLAGSGYNASNDLVCSGSYSNVVGALTPDNFLVFPLSTIVEGSTFSFYACAQDAGYAAEHFAVAVSTDGGNTFANVNEWTMTAKGNKSGVRDARAQGSWHNYSVDLSDYAGMDVNIAIRHFNCTDQFILDVDDVELSINRVNRDGIIGYNVYRSTDNVAYDFLAYVEANEENFYEVFDAPEAGTYFYMVKAVYEDGCESEGAIDGNNPANHYVMVGVTGVGENFAEVSLFPNPTKGNVTIQAQGMHRITVVSVLGQVVYDTELDQDEFVLNMAQFNTGMYLVRVYTDGGVTVKRVTVMH